MPRKIQDFAQQSLIRPVLVNVGRAGAANLDVLQVVEYVKQEAKMVYLLECLQKTAPPVIVFSENKNEVDGEKGWFPDVHGQKADQPPFRHPGIPSPEGSRSCRHPWLEVYVHQRLSCCVLLIAITAQEERQYAIKAFKAGAKDVMVASGVASKGLDFNAVQHVIIFTMPKEIEDYVHQIGRTGRSGKTGIATSFVNRDTPEQTLLDLKYLLMEAGQKYVFDSLTHYLEILGLHMVQGTSVPAEHRRPPTCPGRLPQGMPRLWR
jgi:ATP-dependent RNA helicase DDX41